MKYIYDIIKKYALLLAEREPEGIACARLFLRTEDGCFAVKCGADLRNLKDGDIERLSRPLPFLRGELKAAVYAELPTCARFAASGESGLAASLEDTAQIIGGFASVADAGVDAGAGISAALAENGACFVKNAPAPAGARGAGALAAGRNLYEAVTAVCILEKAAEAAILAEKLGGAKPLPRGEAEALRKKYLESYSGAEAAARAAELGAGQCTEAGPADGTAGDISPEETRLRRELVECGKRLVAEGLVQGTWGNLSARLAGGYMLVTPSGLDYMRLTPEDMVKTPIDGSKCAALPAGTNRRKPTSEKELHGEIYKRRPEVRAVIHTHSRYAGVFAAAEAEMPVLPQYAEALGRAVPLSPYAPPGSRELAENATAALKDGAVAVLMPHHGAACCGESLSEAFSICRAVEKNARDALLP